jgi:hypothetical protein
MKIVAIAAAVLLCGGATRASADVRDPFTVTVHLEVAAPIASRGTAREVRDEAASLWQPYGVELDWIDYTPIECEGIGFEVDAAIEKWPFSAWGAILGQARLGGDPLHNRSVHVSFGATERLLLGNLFSLPGAWVISDHDIARALGRVLAHEIGHVLLAAPYHERDGLMRANFAPRDLLYPDRAPFRLSGGSVWRLKSRVQILRASM